jgi:hypothetical protein
MGSASASAPGMISGGGTGTTSDATISDGAIKASSAVAVETISEGTTSDGVVVVISDGVILEGAMSGGDVRICDSLACTRTSLARRAPVTARDTAALVDSTPVKMSRFNHLTSQEIAVSRAVYLRVGRCDDHEGEHTRHAGFRPIARRGSRHSHANIRAARRCSSPARNG